MLTIVPFALSVRLFFLDGGGVFILFSRKAIISKWKIIQNWCSFKNLITIQNEVKNNIIEFFIKTYALLVLFLVFWVTNAFFRMYLWTLVALSLLNWLVIDEHYHVIQRSYIYK